MRIEEKFKRLNPAGQDAVVAFIDFLLFREAEREELGEEDDTEEEFPCAPPEPQSTAGRSSPDKPSGMSESSGIILAEEREIDDKDDIIDFADINTRFSQKKDGGDTTDQVRKRRMFDWL